MLIAETFLGCIGACEKTIRSEVHITNFGAYIFEYEFQNSLVKNELEISEPDENQTATLELPNVFPIGRINQVKVYKKDNPEDYYKINFKLIPQCL